jgi:hypothetical protein
MQSQSLWRSSSARVPSSPALWGAALAAVLAGATLLVAQTPAAAPAANAAANPEHKPGHAHTRPNAAHPQTTPPPVVQPSPTPVAPPEPELPQWPVNDKPAQASVSWDSLGLRIDATNSSLEQILKDVATATGSKVEGLNGDERVFGVYGPGQVRDVLSQLLEGSGYNVVMIGDQGQGVPRRILLTSRSVGGAQPVAKANPAAGNDEDFDADEAPPPPIRTPNAVQQAESRHQHQGPQPNPPSPPPN